LDPSCLPVLSEFLLLATDKKERPKRECKIFTAKVIEDPFDGVPMPDGAAVPEKPLVKGKKRKGGKEQCLVG
jgi:hypothetical protein